MVKVPSIKEKSVQINLHADYYGTIAEIGGGQETARHLFQAGGASNTVAKSVSAYDKSYSDYFYNDGTSARYVSEERLMKMVNYEYGELLKILNVKCHKRFFVFANTVETLNFSKTNQGNGWLGIAYQGTSRNKPNCMYIHVKLHENDTLLQQYTLGTLGINLIYGALFLGHNPRSMLLSLLDNLDTFRAEIDYVYIDGPDVSHYDIRLLNLLLVSNGMTPAIMFDPNGQVKQPSDLLYKKNVLLMRGYFRPINNMALEYFDTSLSVFKQDEDYTIENTVAFCEISLKNLIQHEELNESDFLHRVDMLNLAGQYVMVSNFYRYFKLVEYFGQFNMLKLRIVLGLSTFKKIFHASQYTDMGGGLLEAMGKLFQQKVKLYLFPQVQSETGVEITPNEYCFEGEYRILWNYLIATRKLLVMPSINSQNHCISSDDMIKMIHRSDAELQSLLPAQVLKAIIQNKLFGYGSEMEVET